MANFTNPDPGTADLKQSRRRTGREPVPLKAPIDSFDIRCQFCPGHAFRRSRLRGRDVGEIMLMRYPVRCLRCSQRQYVSFTVAGLSLSSQIKHSRPVRQLETWKSYTSGANPPFPGATPAYIAPLKTGSELDAVPPSPQTSAAESPVLTDPQAAHPGAPTPPRSDPANNEIW